MKEIDKNDLRKLSSINFYKHINKISINKNIEKNLNEIVPNNTNSNNLNFSLKKLSKANFINPINQNEKLKYKTSKNTPNSSLKKIELNEIYDTNNKKRIKELSEYNYINKFENKKTNLKIYNNKKDEEFFKKINLVYNSNKKIIFNNNNQMKQREKINISNNLKNQQKIINDNATNSNNDNMNVNKLLKTNIFFDNSKSKLVKKKILNLSGAKIHNRNSNLNLTNYMNKSKEYKINNIIYNNYSNNHLHEDASNNNINEISPFFSVKHNNNYSGMLFPNNNNNNSNEKGNKINNLLSSNYSFLYNNMNMNMNMNNNDFNKNNTNKILINYVENKYNNLIENKIFLNDINPKKFMSNKKQSTNDDLNIRNLSTKHKKLKFYIKDKDNISFNNKSNFTANKSINKINNKLLNINQYQNIGDSHFQKCPTTMNSKNNSRKTTPNKIKIKIKYRENLENRNNNLFMSNINNNNLFNGKYKYNFISGNNSKKNLLYNIKEKEKEKESFKYKNNLYDSYKNISYNSYIYNNYNNNKNRKELYLKDKIRNKSNVNIRHIDININKNLFSNSNNKFDKNINIEERNTDSNINKSFKKKIFNDEINYNINQSTKNDLSIKISKEINNKINYNNSTNISGQLINKSNYINDSNNKNIDIKDHSQKKPESSSIIKVNCKFMNKKEEKKEKDLIPKEKNEKNKENLKIFIENKNCIKNIEIKEVPKEEGKDKDNIGVNNLEKEELKNENKINLLDKENKEKKIINISNKNLIINENNKTQNKIIEENKKEQIENKEKEIENELKEIKNNNNLIIDYDNDNENNLVNNSNINTLDNCIKNKIDIISLNENEKENDFNKKEDTNKENEENDILNSSNTNSNMNQNNQNNLNDIIINNTNINTNNENISDNNNNNEERINSNNIYNKNINEFQNISTQVKPPETDNDLNHIITTNFEKNENEIENKKENENEEEQKEISINSIHENINKESVEKENNDEFQELLCNPKKDNEKESEEESILTTQSRDCYYYQNELEKLSSYIKKYYSENNSYPESSIQFYLFGREIGHGAFGKVNLCLHIASGHLVAMKTFVKKDLKYKEAKDKLKHEVEVLSKLHHPFINQILDSFETETHFFIVMEYVCGDLLSFIRKRNKLNEPSAKIIFKQIIEGLKYIHKKKIIHRDIKLDNILIDLSNTIKICDFGVSRKMEKGNIIYERCGTPAYIAPEIYAKIGYEGFKCDIWSAGVTLYYILSGTLPFKGSNIQELEKAILKGEYERIRNVSDEANDIIEGMLRIDPEKRFSIDEILKHPWLNKVNSDNRYRLNIFTEAEKNLLSKYDVDYLNSSKGDLIENFTYRNLVISNTQKKISGNTKSIIYAPYNSCVNEDSKDDDQINIISYLNKEEKALYEELEINNNICKFGWRVKQANINYELSNNDDFDNGLMKTLKEEEFKNKNEKIENHKDNSIKSKTLESIKDYDKIKIDKNILEYIENNVGYDKKYLIKCLKKNIINYSTATYYLLYKDKNK